MLVLLLLLLPLPLLLGTRPGPLQCPHKTHGGKRLPLLLVQPLVQQQLPLLQWPLLLLPLLLPQLVLHQLLLKRAGLPQPAAAAAAVLLVG